MDIRDRQACAAGDASWLDVIRVDGHALIAAAEPNWSRPVPDCPGWDAAGLVRHTGTIAAWMAAILATGERVRFRSLPVPPEDDADLRAWFLANVDRTIGALKQADPQQHVWTFSSLGDDRVSWWRRRLAVEVAIHRWDAQRAASSEGGSVPAPLNADVAAAGVEEFVTEFLPGMLSGCVDRPCGAVGLLLTDATDYVLALDDMVGDEHPVGQVQATVRGTSSAVLLWLTNRGIDSVDLRGDGDLLAAWPRLRR